MAYASLTDLQNGWRELDDVELEQCAHMLESASTWLDAQTGYRFAGKRLDSRESTLLSDITCNIVRRAKKENNPVSTEFEWAQVTNPYEQVSTAANTIGDYYLTKWEMNALGIRGWIAAAGMC